MNKQSFHRSIIFTMILFTSTHAYPHGGGLNSEGCHNERATGGYHCHRGGKASSGDAENGNLALSLILLTSFGITLLVLHVRRNQLSEGSTKDYMLSPKFQLTPYVDDSKFGLEWSVPVHP